MQQRENELASWRRLPARVEVEWLDSVGDTGWQPVNKAHAAPPKMRCLSVGYVFERRRGYLKLVQSLSAEDAVDNTISIPRSAIRKITPLQAKEPG
jgi:hypothetical protein